MKSRLLVALLIGSLFWAPIGPRPADAEDHLRALQRAAARSKHADWGHWGANPDVYSKWTNHSGRLIPIYTFGITLDGFNGVHSVYRDAERLHELYGHLPQGAYNPAAQYIDQTDVYRLQQQAVALGKKQIILIIFDGMDWQTTWAAAIHATGKIPYCEGRGTGLFFQDYRGTTTDFGYFATSPANDGTKVDVDAQTLKNPGGTTPGGYDAHLGGPNPWTPGAGEPGYLIAEYKPQKQAYTDSAASATSMTSGVKTYNAAINVDADGRQVEPIARQLQQRGFAIGVVTSVPISHATPACAYANNVHRDDYQDIARDLVGLPSVAHRAHPLPGVDVLLGDGWGSVLPRPGWKPTKDDDDPQFGQGKNFVPGSAYITVEDMAKIDLAHGGKYRVVERQAGVNGSRALHAAAQAAADRGERLFGFFGCKLGHLPFRTADGDYNPTVNGAPPKNGAPRRERYTAADLDENPKLADMAGAALTVLSRNKTGFWLMIEAGDVDWANHTNNLDNSIGAVQSGDAAFREVVNWIEGRHAWDDSAVIVTSDHGHYLFLDHPEAILAWPTRARGVATARAHDPNRKTVEEPNSEEQGEWAGSPGTKKGP